jgi:hypothetical protein
MNMETLMRPSPRNPVDNEPALDRDAALALQTLSRQVALVARSASIRARALGNAVTVQYRDALRASKDEPSRRAWRRFVAALWAFASELDRCTPERSAQSIAARGGLDRIVFENFDLLA